MLCSLLRWLQPRQSSPMPGRRIWFLARSRLQARKTWSFPRRGQGRGVLYLRVHALLILRSFRTTITPDQSGKQAGKQLKERQGKAAFLGPNAARGGCSWRTGSADGIRGTERLHPALAHRPGCRVGYCGLLPARGAGARQVTARSEKRKSKRVIHHSPPCPTCSHMLPSHIPALPAR